MLAAKKKKIYLYTPTGDVASPFKKKVKQFDNADKLKLEKYLDRVGAVTAIPKADYPVEDPESVWDVLTFPEDLELEDKGEYVVVYEETSLNDQVRWNVISCQSRTRCRFLPTYHVCLQKRFLNLYLHFLLGWYLSFLKVNSDKMRPAINL